MEPKKDRGEGEQRKKIKNNKINKFKLKTHKYSWAAKMHSTYPAQKLTGFEAA